MTSKDKINELIAIEVMGWIVFDSTSYKDQHNDVIQGFNPMDNAQQAIWALIKLHEQGYGWKIAPNDKGRPVVEIQDKNGEYLCHSSTPKLSHAICYAILSASGLTKELAI